MSATIPNSMLLSDLLKATGYDCPDTLQGKTFKQATAGAGIDLEANHASSVNVSEYSQPIEITPSATYEAMEKVTLTLTGIPDLETNHAVSINAGTYTLPVEVTPTEGKDGMEKVTVTITDLIKGLVAFGSAGGAVYLTAIPSEDGAVKAYVPSATGISKVDATYAEATGVTISDVAYARYSDGDITF